VAQPAPPPRIWGGSTLDARRDARRERLLDVGLELLGGPGGAPAVTVRSVCRHAKLTDRYFYESFADRDELLRAVFDRVGGEAREVLARAVAETAAGSGSADATPEAVARAAVRAFVEMLTADPRKGRVLLLAPITDPGLNERALRLQPAFTELLRLQLAAGTGAAAGDPGAAVPLEQRLTAAALIGALSQLFIRWLDGSLAVTVPELTDYCVRMLVHAVPLAAAPKP
jgi:AcrR family transcriptional regulator